MSNFKLNLPTDIPWERMCVSSDMLARRNPISAEVKLSLPPRWNSSLAVFKYEPEEEFQTHPKYKITYLKVTATITGFQLQSDEIKGEIKLSRLNTATREDVQNFLNNSFSPCTGAILQVSVLPKKPSNTLFGYISGRNDPFFIDFEPKKREMYEMATDTKEKSSRSLETINVTKSGSNTKSVEALDIDMGGSSSSGTNVGIPGVGSLGVSNSSAVQGQWGTKRVNGEESMVAQVTEHGQEKRETQAFTTQISQMYNLLNSYHLGTNRALFYILSRPHVLEVPSGFTRGPRGVDGIQEFFLIVAEPKDSPGFCVHLQLDTAHLATEPIMDYERKTITTQLYNVEAILATQGNSEKIMPPDVPVNPPYTIPGVGPEGMMGFNWFQRFEQEKTLSDTYLAELGYTIESVKITREERNGTGGFGAPVYTKINYDIAPDGKTMNISLYAKSFGIFYLGFGLSPELILYVHKLYNADGRIFSRLHTFARIQFEITLRSDEKTKKLGDKDTLLITTRGLECCAGEEDDDRPFYFPDPRSDYTISVASFTANEVGYLTNDAQPQLSLRNRKFTPQESNELSNLMMSKMIDHLNSFDIEEKTSDVLHSDYFVEGLKNQMIQSPASRYRLNNPINELLKKEELVKLQEVLKKDTISRYELINLPSMALAEVLNCSKTEIQRLKLKAMGLEFNEEEENKDKSKDFEVE